MTMTERELDLENLQQLQKKAIEDGKLFPAWDWELEKIVGKLPA